MYFRVIQQFKLTLTNLDNILEKAIAHARKKDFDPSNFCQARLAPDMFTFTRQIQIATDVAKSAAATLSGKEIPKFEDNESSLPELQTRIRKCVAFLDTFAEKDFAHLTNSTVVKVPYPAGKAMLAPDALITRAIPNLFFHVTAAYAILRAGGVDVGKEDFLGKIPMFDA